MSNSSASSGSPGLLLFVALVAAVLILPRLLPFGDGSGGLTPGESVPPIKGEGWVNGEIPAQAELSGKVLVLHAWASW